MNRICKSVTLAGAAAVMLLGSTAVWAETVTLRIASFTPAKEFVSAELIPGFLDKVVADSEGTLDYKIFAGGTLGRNPGEQLKLVQDGVADMAFVIPSYTAGAFPSWGVVEIPGVVKNEIESALALRKAVDEGLLETPAGVVLPGVWSTEVNGIHGSNELTSLDDLKGQRIRAIGKPQVVALERLGAAGVTGLRAGEVAEAVSRGTVDAVLMGHAALNSFRVTEVVDSHIRVPMGAIGMMLPMNADTWEQLPEPAKAAFAKHGGQAFTEYAAEMFHRINIERAAEIYGRDGESDLEVTDAVLAEFNTRLGAIEEVWIDGDAHRQMVFDRFTQILEEIRAGS